MSIDTSNPSTEFFRSPFGEITNEIKHNVDPSSTDSDGYLHKNYMD